MIPGLSRPCQIEHYRATDVRGATEWELAGSEDAACSLQPVSSRESTANTTQETSEWVLYLPSEVNVGANDRVTVDGVSFEVAGPSRPWSDLASRPHHIEVTLRRVT
jgi:hypothetical protein